MELKNFVLMNDGVRVEQGDILVTNGFHEIITWSGLDQLTTQLRVISHKDAVDGDFSIISCYNNDRLNEIHLFLLELGFVHKDNSYILDKGGNLMAISIFTSTKEKPFIKREVIVDVDAGSTKKKMEFAYVHLKGNALQFYDGDYYRPSVEFQIINEDGKIKFIS